MRRLCCLVVGVVSGVAFAQTPTPRALFEEGTRLYEQGAFEQAAEKFDASFSLRPVPVARFNAARAWEKAGKTLKAIDAWQAWLAASPSAPNRGEAESALRALGDKLAKQGLQALTLRSLPVGARVTIDGQASGVTPITVELLTGRHLLRLELEGREPLEKTIDFTLEAPRAELFELAAVGSAVAAPSVPPLLPSPLPPVAEAAVRVSTAPPASVSLVRSPPRERRLRATWIALGAAGLGLLSAAVFAAVGWATSSQLTDGVVRSGMKNDELVGLVQGTNTGALVSLVTAGAAAVATGICLGVEW